jgi:exodeoxyribonuclease V alpha subunit
LSAAVNRGDWSSGWALLKESTGGDIAWRDLPARSVLRSALKERVLGGFRTIFESLDPGRLMEGMDRFRILCGLREGPFGAAALNLLVEEVLRGEGLIRREGKWYPGRPVLITRNDYDLNLFNGDTGMALPDLGEEASALRVYFPTSNGGIRKVHPLRLPEHETCYAMTVHKSQGSEFDNVVLLLPDRDAPVITRELVYTGVTRARHSVEIWGRQEVFRAALEKCTERRSGLRDALWGGK